MQNQPQPTREADPTARLTASLKRCAFLLNSARLVIADPVASDTAAQAVAEAQAALAAAERAARC